MSIQVRKYRPGEETHLWQLFYMTIRNVNAADYTLEQLQAWAPDERDEQQWRRRIESNQPYVCILDDVIVGFTDLQSTGYIDHFFVHHAWQRRGIGKLLFATIEMEARVLHLPELTANVSLTARPFFEANGFRVTTSQEVVLGKVVLRNFKMVKDLRD